MASKKLKTKMKKTMEMSPQYKMLREMDYSKPEKKVKKKK